MKRQMLIKHHHIGLRLIAALPETSQLPGFYFCIGLMSFFLIFQFWNAITVYNDLDKLMVNLISTIGLISGLFKIITFHLKRKNLMLAVSTILEDWNIERKVVLNDVIKENCIRSKLLSKFIIVLYNTMNFMYLLKVMVSYSVDPVEDRKFFVEDTFPIDGKQSPAYELLTVGQFISSFLCFNFHALIEGLLATMVLHACSKANILQLEIEKLSKVYQTKCNNKMFLLFTLKNLSKEHKKFIEFSKSIQNVFLNVSFFHIFFITLLQVISVYMFIDVLERDTESLNLIHYAILTISFLISTGYYCIIGEYLTYHSEQLFTELYNCSWYEFSTSEQKLISFILLNARKPIALKVGKFNHLSLSYLTSIIKTSFSYFSLIRAVR